MKSHEYKTLEFQKTIDGRMIPLQPWPVKFFVSQEFIHDCRIEVRPLTFTGFVKAVTQNFISMNYWRFLNRLWKMGFLRTQICECFSWRHFTFKFWNVLKKRRVDEDYFKKSDYKPWEGTGADDCAISQETLLKAFEQVINEEIKQSDLEGDK